MIETPYLIGGVIISVIVLIGIIWTVKKQKNSTPPDEPKNSEAINLNTELIEDPLKRIDSIVPDLDIQIDPKVEKLVDNTTITEEVDTIKKEVITELEEQKTKVNVNISSKTEKLLLKKLEHFEVSKGFIKKDVNLNKLAKEFDTNTKYLSEIIKSYKNKNFNQYLNELRINYLIDQLNSNDKVLNTKVSYLASDIGFSSHSTFTTLFTQYIGQSPSEYIKALKEKKKLNQA